MVQNRTVQYQTRNKFFKEQVFFLMSQLIWGLAYPLFSHSKISSLSMCFYIENSLQMKRCQKDFLLSNQIFLHLYTRLFMKILTKKKKKKKTSNCFFVDLARLFQNFKIKSETLEDKN
jgi:hypothetical protein